MVLIDPTVTWKKAQERLAAETDPVLRRNLELLLQHMKAEASLDMEKLMATVSPNAQYFSYGSSDSPPLIGKAAVQAFYEAFAASGAHKLQHDIDRLIVDRHAILTEGVIRIAYPGRALAARGIDVDDPTAFYLYEARMAIVWPIGEDGLFTGEDSYVGNDGFAGIEQRKLGEADVKEWTPAASTG
jgi:hypothetical protein